MTTGQLLAAFDEAGAEHGAAAASWFFDGNTSRETYERVLRGIEDGDPMVLDSLPEAPLSREYADAPSPRSVLAEFGVSEDDDRADDLLCAYEDAFYRASQDSIERACRHHLA